MPGARVIMNHVIDGDLLLCRFVQVCAGWLCRSCAGVEECINSILQG